MTTTQSTALFMQLIQAGVLGSISMVIVQWLKPYIEKALPPTDPRHDGTLQFLNIVVTVLAVLGLAWFLNGSITRDDIVLYLGQTFLGSQWADFIYKAKNKTGAGNTPPADNPAPGTPTLPAGTLTTLDAAVRQAQQTLASAPTTV